MIFDNQNRVTTTNAVSVLEGQGVDEETGEGLVPVPVLASRTSTRPQRRIHATHSFDTSSFYF